ncbi:hypothetical protein BC832DRAFT_91042 [Gaertneriomyces semiglobifer]|nr:hypothetical protein BC832DRAFT_91042 [Gaertneriomyces semiglobifer]
MASTPSRDQILALYRHLLRSSRSFANYNYRSYVHRRAKDAFRAHATETDPARISALYQQGRTDLDVARRQGWLNSQFKVNRSVAEV